MSLGIKLRLESNFYLDHLIEAHERQPANQQFEVAGKRLQAFPQVFSPVLATSSLLFAKVVSESNLQDHYCVDAGCGTGLLSVAACTAGARKVLSFDLSLRAVLNSQRNAQNAGYSDLILPLALKNFPYLKKGGIDTVFSNPPFFDLPPEVPWHSAFCDSDRQLFWSVIDGSARSLRSGGTLYVACGGELQPDFVIETLSNDLFVGARVVAEKEDDIKVSIVSAHRSENQFDVSKMFR